MVGPRSRAVFSIVLSCLVSYAFRIHAFVIGLRDEPYDMSELRAFIWQEFIQFLYYEAVMGLTRTGATSTRTRTNITVTGPTTTGRSSSVPLLRGSDGVNKDWNQEHKDKD